MGFVGPVCRGAVPHLCVELHEVVDLVLAAMRNWGLASYDAAHAATTQFVQADGLVTTDAGFGSVPTTSCASIPMTLASGLVVGDAADGNAGNPGQIGTGQARSLVGEPVGDASF